MMKLTSEKNVVVYNPADKTIKILKKNYRKNATLCGSADEKIG